MSGEKPFRAGVRDRNGDLDRELLAAATRSSDLDAPADQPRFAGGQVAREIGPVGLAQTRGKDELAQLAAERFLPAIAEGALRRRVPLGDVAALVHGDDAIERGAQDRVLARLLVGERLRALAHAQLELLVRLPQLLAAGGDGAREARVVSGQQHGRREDDEGEAADRVRHPHAVELRSRGEADRFRVELRRHHGGEVHADHRSAHHEGGAEVGEHRALLGEMEGNPQRRRRGADGDQHRGDEEPWVVLDTGREAHRRVARVMHRSDADADERAGHEELAMLAGKPAQHHECRPARHDGEHPGERRQGKVVHDLNRQLQGERGDEMHRPDADAHRDAPARHPQLPIGGVRIAHARGEQQRHVRRGHRDEIRQEHQPEIEVLRHFDDHVRLDIPTILKDDGCGFIFNVPFGGAAISPCGKRFDSGVAQPPLICKMTVGRVGEPRRHLPIHDCSFHCFRPRSCFRVGQE